MLRFPNARHVDWALFDEADADGRWFGLHRLRGQVPEGMDEPFQASTVTDLQERQLDLLGIDGPFRPKGPDMNQAHHTGCPDQGAGSFRPALTIARTELAAID